MDIKEFQKKLVKLLAMAREGGNAISQEQVKELFAEDGLDEGQLGKVYDYLAAQKIEVPGRMPGKTEEERCEEEAAPLTVEEKAYLNIYREQLVKGQYSESELEALFDRSKAGEEESRKRLIEYYMPLVVEEALKLHREGVFLGDMISEGNMHLIMAVNRLDTWQGFEQQLIRGIHDGILFFIEEQTEQKRQDHFMVDKVTRLEAAIKELTDGDDEIQLSVDELSVFLDMTREEIEDILRLTGEDGGQKS